MFQLKLVIWLFGGSFHLNAIQSSGDKKMSHEHPLFTVEG